MSLPTWVLVVDDDRDMCQAMLEVLSDSGFTARAAGGYRRALELLRGDDPPVFVIADLMMSDGDGLQLLDQARAREIPGMLITAADPRKLSAALAITVMRKPFDVDEFIATVALACPHAVDPRAETVDI